MHSVAKFSLACWTTGARSLVILAGSFAASTWGGTNIVTTTADSGEGSFRQALLSANSNPGPDTIVFQISGSPPFTITPGSALPPITGPVVIDATTQPEFAGTPVVELKGAATSPGTVGLLFSTGAGTLRGLAINSFPGHLIELASAANILQGNFIGTDVTGTQPRGSGSGSFGILAKSAGNLIGGTNAGDGNVISGGNDTGIYLFGANNNVVQGNFIGVTATGTASLGNLTNGIIIYGSGGNLIGGPVPAARNIISGNGGSGVYLAGSTTTGNVIQGNRIGTDSSGSNAVSNVAGDGISIIGAPGNVVSSNLISANGLAGISIQGASGNQLLGNFIGPDVNGRIGLPNRNSGVSVSGGGGNHIGSTNAGDGNLISGNRLDGVTLTGGTSANMIQGNVIGLTAAGNAFLRNNQNGITISSATANLIGGVAAGARNVISGNTNNGIAILQLADSGNTVQGNYIGTDVTGNAPVANRRAGVLIRGSANIVGGTVPGAGNVISGNTHQGIWIVGNNGNVQGNVIQGNLIGLNASGTRDLGNGIATDDSGGIGISTASANLVGGTEPGAANAISGNTGAGIFMVGTTASSNVVQGNFIGTDLSGTVAIGNIWEGIYLEQAATNQIGGTASGARNLISANYSVGIFLTNASWNVIQGNCVGTAVDGTNNLANQFHNVELQLNASNNVIGGADAGAGNRLAFASMNRTKAYCGVRVRTGAVNNLISGNSIFSNGALGIDLNPTDGTANPGVNTIVDCEGDVVAVAANAGQNFPTLSNVCGGAITQVRGSLNSKSGQTYTLQFFASPVSDSSSYGEGQLFLGQTDLTLGSLSCSSDFTAYLPTPVPPGWVVTATATDPSHNTSEFSASVPVTNATPVVGWNPVGPIVYGTPLGTNQNNATSSVPGNFVYTSTNGVVLPAGTNLLHTVFTPTDTNYTSVSLNAPLVVLPVPLVVTVDDQVRAYSQTNPPLTYGITGFVNSETSSVVSGAVAVSTPAILSSPVGSYPINISQGSLSASNYTFSFTSGTLTITNATPEVGWNPVGPIVYGTPLGTNQNNATSSVPGNFVYTSTNGVVLPAGTNLLTTVFTPDDTNYTTVSLNAPLVVLPAPLVVAADDQVRAYNQGNPPLTYGITGFVNSETASVVSGSAALSTPAILSSPAGSYPINISQGSLSASNYTFSFTSGTLTVTAVAVVPPLQVNQPGPGQLALSWTNNGGSFALQQTYSLTPPIVWLPVTDVPVLQDNFMVITQEMTNSKTFYRLLAP